MKTPLRLALAVLACAASPLAFGHARLVASSPAMDQQLDAPPIEIRLSFDERIDPRHASIKLVSAEGKRFDADRPHADSADPNSLLASVPVLKRGVWRARWTAVGADGHRLRGDLSFTVR